MLSCNNLNLRINRHVLTCQLGFTLFPGTILSILGKNGVGKTSLLKVLATLRNGYEDSLTYNGVKISENLNEYKDLITYIGHENFLFEELTVFENLEFWAKIKGRELSVLPAAMVYSLHPLFQKNIKDLSLGTKKKVLLTILLLSNSKIWLLDEPFVNLDDESVAILVNIFQSKAQQGGIIIFSSHLNIKIDNSVAIDLKDFRYA